MKNKKAQVWGLDLVVACVIFFTGILVLYFYAINYGGGAGKQLNEMTYEGDVASEFILSNGELGILSDNKINQTKLENFYNTDYLVKKRQLNLVYNFYFEIDGLEINENPASFVGKINETKIEDNVKITRFAIYKNKPVKFQLYIWR